jgi:hypothetical protein
VGDAPVSVEFALLNLAMQGYANRVNSENIDNRVWGRPADNWGLMIPLVDCKKEARAALATPASLSAREEAG